MTILKYYDEVVERMINQAYNFEAPQIFGFNGIFLYSYRLVRA